MKKLAFFLGIMAFLAVSCEKNETVKEKTVAEYEYINMLARTGDVLWVISSQPGNYLSFVPVIPPYRISKVSLIDEKVILSKDIPAIEAITTDSDDQVFLCALDRKILKLNPDLTTDQLFTIPGRSFLREMICDGNNNLWLATNDRGLYLYDGNDTITFNSSNSILKYDWIPSITKDSGSNIWFVQGPDLYRVDHHLILSKDPYQLPITNNSGVFNLSANSNNTLFCSKWDGNYEKILKKEMNGPWTIINPPASSNNRPVRNIKTDSYGTVWIIYSVYPKDVVAYYDNEKWVELEIPMDEVVVNDIETYNNKILLGTTKGIVTISKNRSFFAF